MPQIDSTIIEILVKDVAIPELLALLHRSVQDDQTIVITLSKDSARVKAAGQAFLDATK